MNESRYGDGIAPAWEIELDGLCAGESGWRLLQCLSSLAVLRAADSSSDDGGEILPALARALGEGCSRETLDEALGEALMKAAAECRLSSDDRAFFEARVKALPTEIEVWAADSGLFRSAELSDAGSEDASCSALGEAARELIRVVELIPIEEDGCFDAVVRRCLASSGRMGGLFSTPECVVDLVARILAPSMESAVSLYDPCCGAGFLLDACLASHPGEGGAPDVFGQDIDPEAHAFLRARVLLAAILAERAGKPSPAFDLRLGNVLEGCWHRDEIPFDVIVSHPPTLMEWAGASNEALAVDERFACAGAMAPREAADLAFVLHAYHCLSERGVAALIVYPAPLRRGDSERTIRRYLIEQNAIDAVIQLPPRLFLDSSMAASVLVLRKGRERDDVLFVNAMEEGAKLGEGNVVAPESIERIVGAFELRGETSGFARNVPKGEVVKNAWSLTVADYFKTDTGKMPVNMDFLKRISASYSDVGAARREKLVGILPS